MRGVKNLKVMAAGLCLGATLLTGCGGYKMCFDNKFTINYEFEVPEGTISYEDLINYIKIVTFEQDEKIVNCLLIKQVTNHNSSVDDRDYNHIEYYDFKTGTCIINYDNYINIDKTVWDLGENLNIKEEKSFELYLVMENYIKSEYTIEEILTFFEEKIKPNLESSEKELVK